MTEVMRVRIGFGGNFRVAFGETNETMNVISHLLR